MCYPKPGPRCSNHAQQALERAKKRYMQNPSSLNQHALYQAQEAFSMTPAGIAQHRENGREEKAQAWEKRRERSIAAFRDLQKRPPVWECESEAEFAVIEKVVEPMEDFLDEEEIENHAPDNDVAEWVSLRSMDNALRAGNNCHAATWYALETIVEQVGLDPSDDAEVRSMVFDDDTYHFAVQVSTEGKDVIVDYTARQFSDDFPFPYVAEQDKWEDTISRYAQARWGITRKS